MSFSRSVLESHVLALAVAQLVEPLQQRLHRRGVLPGSEGEEADSVHLPRRLRLGGERPGEEAAAQGTKERSTIHGRSLLWRPKGRIPVRGSYLTQPAPTCGPLDHLPPAAAPRAWRPTIRQVIAWSPASDEQLFQWPRIGTDPHGELVPSL